MAMSRRSGRSRLTLAVLVLTSVTVLTLDFRGADVVDEVRGAASTVFSPVRSAADTVFAPVGDAWSGVTGYDELEAENEELRRQLDDLRGTAAANEDAAQQLEEISEANGLALPNDIPTTLARVVSGPLSNFERTVALDKGSSADIAVGMPVVNGAGLVGRVVEVSSNRAVVELISEPDLAIGVRLTSSQEVGIAHGTGDGNPLQVDSGIGPKVEIPDDEVVTTSGLDRSIFPPGLPVGRVTGKELSADGLTQILTVDPLADLADLSFVRVLLWSPPS